MEIKADQLSDLQAVYPEVEVLEEGAVPVLLIKNLRLPDGCEPEWLNALLWPFPRDGYPSRLFLSQKINHKGKGTNWNADGVPIVGLKWWAVSWKTNRTDQSLLSMMGTHLDAFRP
jgi:hypothetical protein